MHDLLPAESARARALVDAFAAHVDLAGFGEITTPILESLDVFLRVGAGTDVVSKEMYVFTDRDGSEIALRPETTASVARAYLQHHPVPPWKVWYFSQHFRHERPQKGRLRQHHQLGVEVIGSPDPDVDVDVIVLLWDFYTKVLGLDRIRLEINSIGEPASRVAYAGVLSDFLRGVAGQIDETDAAKIESHPLRVLDSKVATTRAAIADAPRFADSMSPEAVAHFERVGAGLGAAGIPFTVNERLVRGLDYYTHTVFEIVSEAIDASQSTIGGGGRFDGLIEAMGGDPTPGIGFGSGVERVLLACDAEAVFPAPASGSDCFVVNFGGDGADVRDLCVELRRAGISAERSYDGRSAKAQMKAADRAGARFALLLGDDERSAGTVTTRDLRGAGDQASVARTELINHLRTLL
jgi:histidyl-tRNA synthetase